MKTFYVKDPKLIAVWKKVLVDDEDFEKVNKYTWHLTSNGYVRTNYYKQNGKRGPLYLTRYILNIMEEDEIEIDHIDRNKLNNQKENLRYCDRSQNMWNQGPRSNRKYKGAYFHKQSGKWQSMIMYGRKMIALGLYETEIEAAEAYDVAAKQYFKEFAYLNFPKKVKP